MYVVDSAVALCKTQLHTKNNALAISFFKTLAEDLSWRVRYYFCDKLVEVAQSSGKDQYKKLFQPYHLKFLQDPEPEMKSIACLRIEGLADHMDPEDILNKLVPLLKVIQADTNAFVRSNAIHIYIRLDGIIYPGFITRTR